MRLSAEGQPSAEGPGQKTLDKLSLMCYTVFRKRGKNMDALKKATSRDYTAWDLNCPHYVRVKNRQKLEAKFKRKARRNFKKELDKMLRKCYN